MIRNTVLMLWIVAPVLAGSVEFAMAEFKRALAVQGLTETAVRFQTKLVEGKPECYTVSHGLITGTNERGLMSPHYRRCRRFQ